MSPAVCKKLDPWPGPGQDQNQGPTTGGQSQAGRRRLRASRASTAGLSHGRDRAGSGDEEDRPRKRPDKTETSSSRNEAQAESQPKVKIESLQENREKQPLTGRSTNALNLILKQPLTGRSLGAREQTALTSRLILPNLNCIPNAVNHCRSRVTSLCWHPRDPDILLVGGKHGEIAVVRDFEAGAVGTVGNRELDEGIGPGGSITDFQFDAWDDHVFYTSSICGHVARRDLRDTSNCSLADTGHGGHT